MFELVRANRRKSALLMLAMALLLMLVGYALGELRVEGGGLAGLIVALLIWVAMSLTAYFAGGRIMMASSGARRLSREDHPPLWNVVEEMCIASGLSQIPDLYLIDSEVPNAFASGWGADDAAVAVTAGLLERLDRDELQGVIAHELAHVHHRDVLYMTMAAVMLGTIALLADVGVRALWWGGGRRRTSSDRAHGPRLAVLAVSLLLVVLAPIAAQLLYFATSRRREYLADAAAVLYTRYPDGLARALEKIAGGRAPLRGASRATAAMYIVNPLTPARLKLSDLSSTHPSTEDRVRILRSLAGAPLSPKRYDQAFVELSGRPVGVVPAAWAAHGEEIAPRSAEPDRRGRQMRVRETTDALWRLRHFAFVGCECGTRIKAPPEHAGNEIGCPHCGRRHRLSRVA